MTLVILMLLSIFMVEFSFQTTLETRGIRNFQASFQARNAVKSMLKAVLEGLQTRDEITFFRQDLQFLQELNALAGVENASILNLVEMWKDEESRHKMIKLAEIRKKALEEEVERLSTMDEIKCRIMGLTEEEVLNG